MNVPHETVLAVQRHFLGTLRAPVKNWLEVDGATRLVLIGEGLRAESDECILDFGIVDVQSPARRTVRVLTEAGESVEVDAATLPSWAECETSTNAITVKTRCNDEGHHRGAIRLVISGRHGEREETLQLRVVSRKQHPVAAFDFDGSPEPHAFDFGDHGHAVTIGVHNDSAVPLTVSFSDLPYWLTFEIEGSRRAGPLQGRFFERKAPFTVAIRPHFLGRHRGVMRLQTNDPRPELQDIELNFSGSMADPQPHLRAITPKPVSARTDQPLMTMVQLENWGRLPARVLCSAAPPAIAVAKIPPVPAADDGVPGSAILPIGISPDLLTPGTHHLVLSLQIDGGEPPKIAVPIRIDVTAAPARPKSVMRPEVIIAVVLLLLLTVLFVFASRGWS